MSKLVSDDCHEKANILHPENKIIGTYDAKVNNFDAINSELSSFG